MNSNRHVLLASTAILAISLILPHQAHAQAAISQTVDGQWASSGSGADTGNIEDALEGASLSIDGNAVDITVTEDGIANDDDPFFFGTPGFIIGDITDNSGANDGDLFVTSGAGGDTMLSILAASTLDGNVSLSNSDPDNASVTVFTDALTIGNNLTLTNNETDFGAIVGLAADGALSVGGATTITAGNAANANAELVLGSTGTFTGGVTLNDGTSGRASIVFDGIGAQTLNFNINGDSGGEGSVIISNSAGVNISSAIGSGTDIRDVTLTLGGNATANADINAGVINIGAGSTLTANNNLAGTTGVNFTGAGIYALGNGIDFAGAIDNTSGVGGVGTLTSASAGGNNSIIGGAVGASNSLSAINLTGTGTFRFDSTVNANTITASAAGGTLDFNDTVTGNINLADNATVNLAAGGFTVNGAINNTSGSDGSGSLILGTGSAINITGNVGASNSLSSITLSDTGNDIFGGTVNADDINFTGASSATFNGSVTSSGGIDFNDNAGTVSFADDADLAGNILSTGGVNGTITFLGSSAVTGQLGTTAGTGFANLNINGANETVSVSGDSFGTNFSSVANSIFNPSGNVTLTGTATNNGTINIDAGNIFTANGGFLGTGTYSLEVRDDGNMILDTADVGQLASTGAIDLAAETLDLRFNVNAQGGDVVIAAGGAPAVNAGTLTVSENSALFDAVVNPMGNDLVLSVTRLETSTATNNTNAQSVIDAATGITGGDANFMQFQTNLGSQSGQQLQNTVDSVTPSDHEVTSQQAQDTTNQVTSIIQNRMNSINKKKASSSTASILSAKSTPDSSEQETKKQKTTTVSLPQTDGAPEVSITFPEGTPPVTIEKADPDKPKPGTITIPGKNGPLFINLNMPDQPIRGFVIEVETNDPRARLYHFSEKDDKWIDLIEGGSDFGGDPSTISVEYDETTGKLRYTFNYDTQSEKNGADNSNVDLIDIKPLEKKAADALQRSIDLSDKIAEQIEILDSYKDKRYDLRRKIKALQEDENDRDSDEDIGDFKKYEKIVSEYEAANGERDSSISQSEIKSLETDLKIDEEGRASFVSEKRELEDRKRSLSSELITLERQEGELLDKRNEAENKYEDLDDKWDDLEDDLDDVLDEIQDLEYEIEEIGEIEDELNEFKDERTEIEGEIDSLEEELEEVKKKLEKDPSAGDLSEQQESLQRSIRRYKNDLQDVQGEIGNLQNQLDSSSYEDLKAALQKKEAEKKVIREERGTISREVRQLEGTLEDLNDQIDDIKDQMSDVEGGLRSIRSKTRDLDERIEEYDRNISNTESSIEKIEDYEEAKEILASAQRRLDDAQKTDARIKELQEELKPLNEEIEKIEGEIKSNQNAFELSIKEESKAIKELNDAKAENERRLDNANKNSGIPGGDAFSSLAGWSFWGQVFGSNSEQGFRKGSAGADTQTRGVVFGADTPDLIDDMVIGATFSFANAESRGDDINAALTQTDTYLFSVYASRDLDDRTSLSGTVSYGFNEIESTRFNIGGISGLAATSDYNAHQLAASASVSRNYEYKGVSLSPSVSTNWSRYNPETYEQRDAGDLSTTVDNETSDVFALGVGLNATKQFEYKGGNYLPSFDIGYTYDLIGDAVTSTSQFAAGGPTFDTTGNSPAQGTFSSAVGLQFSKDETWEFSGGLGVQLRDEFRSDNAFIKVKYKF